MMPEYKSHFAKYMHGLILEKQALGYVYCQEQKQLRWFDEFCTANFPKEKELTQELLNAYSVRKSTEKPSGFSRRLIPIRELGKYMNRIGVKAYILPTSIAPKKIKFVPHIFTNPELDTFFQTVDSLRFSNHSPARHLVLPVMFRLMYCCGLRPAEAIALKTINVDLENGNISILQSKMRKDRIVVMSDEMLDLCRIYRQKASLIFPRNEYFFPSPNGTHYATTPVYIMLQQYWKLAGLSESGAKPPRLYDFRHTFATKRINEWITQGKDLNACLPYLSEYMGHYSFTDTAYYFHLVPEIYPHIEKITEELYAGAIPEVFHED